MVGKSDYRPSQYDKDEEDNDIEKTDLRRQPRDILIISGILFYLQFPKRIIHISQ